MNISLKNNNGKQFAEDKRGILYEVSNIEEVNYLPSKGIEKTIYIVGDKAFYCSVINIKQVEFKLNEIKKVKEKPVKEIVEVKE